MCGASYLRCQLTLHVMPGPWEGWRQRMLIQPALTAASSICVAHSVPARACYRHRWGTKWRLLKVRCNSDANDFHQHTSESGSLITVEWYKHMIKENTGRMCVIKTVRKLPITATAAEGNVTFIQGHSFHQTKYQYFSITDERSPLCSIRNGEMPRLHRRLDLILGESHLTQSDKQRSDSLQHMFTCFTTLNSLWEQVTHNSTS